MSASGTAWALPSHDAGRFDREVRVSDAAAFACLPFGLVLAPGTGLPLNEVAGLGLVALTLFRPPAPGGRRPPWFAAALAGIALLLLASALLNDVDGLRRLVHVATWSGLALGLSSGRISGRSAGIGLSAGLLAACAASVLLLGATTYEGRLTGVLGDPNAAALVLVVYGCVCLSLPLPPPVRVLLAVVAATCVVLTFSRTGLMAVSAALLWVHVGRRLGPVIGAGLMGALLVVVTRLPASVQQIGPFSDRSGSDDLRRRIVVAEDALIEAAAWYGNGPGTSVVQLDDDDFFFHNSYLAALNEGGWPLLVVLVALTAATFLSLSRRARDTPRVAWLQASLVGVAIMAVTLGEVWLELPAAVALGFAMRAYAVRDDPATTPWAARREAS